MKQTFTRAILIYSLFFGFACSPKQSFYLNKGTGSFGSFEKKLREQVPINDAPVSIAEKNTLRREESVAFSFMASTQPTSSNLASSIIKRMADVDNKSFIVSEASQKNNRQEKLGPEINKRPEILKKKYSAATEEGKPTHKLANLGLILGIGGWVLALIALLSGGAALLLLLAFGLFIAGYFTSKKGLSEIKKAPDQYGGKGVAKAGMIISGLILVAIVAFILYVLAFAGAFG